MRSPVRGPPPGNYDRDCEQNYGKHAQEHVCRRQRDENRAQPQKLVQDASVIGSQSTRRGVVGHWRNGTGLLIEALAEFLTVRWRRNTSSRSGRVGIRPRDKHYSNSLPASPVHNHPGLRIVCKTGMICETMSASGTKRPFHD